MRSGSREKRGDEEEAGLNTLRPTSNAAFPSKNKQIRGSQCEICGLIIFRKQKQSKSTSKRKIKIEREIFD